jgi:hypothetical protein
MYSTRRTANRTTAAIQVGWKMSWKLALLKDSKR